VAHTNNSRDLASVGPLPEWERALQRGRAVWDVEARPDVSAISPPKGGPDRSGCPDPGQRCWCTGGAARCGVDARLLVDRETPAKRLRVEPLRTRQLVEGAVQRGVADLGHLELLVQPQRSDADRERERIDADMDQRPPDDLHRGREPAHLLDVRDIRGADLGLDTGTDGVDPGGELAQTQRFVTVARNKCCLRLPSESSSPLATPRRAWPAGNLPRGRSSRGQSFNTDPSRPVVRGPLRQIPTELVSCRASDEGSQC